MTLLERYLQILGPLLPRKGREDILREISEDILSEMDEKQEELGRPLNAAEQEKIIQRRGHPVVAAARYRSLQYLIGPDWFPIYWLILRIAGGGALIVRTIVALVTILAGRDPSGAVAGRLGRDSFRAGTRLLLGDWGVCGI